MLGGLLASASEPGGNRFRIWWEIYCLDICFCIGERASPDGPIIYTNLYCKNFPKDFEESDVKSLYYFCFQNLLFLFLA